MAAWHETAEPFAVKGLRNVVVFHGMITSTRPAIAKGGERAHPHADRIRVPE
jgi:hypothetical protein